eukprot:TRINITY_DN26104_c0_g2_i1.p1 TRINITY_DN26104_c0_g2~~TRINITY_DN26104_c0_g2_i1.p1  ORF type:complete len:1013 (+),score=110.73 TRINITY_DN26104_c0_g2_i1:316-3039(+)
MADFREKANQRLSKVLDTVWNRTGGLANESEQWAEELQRNESEAAQLSELLEHLRHDFPHQVEERVKAMREESIAQVRALELDVGLRRSILPSTHPSAMLNGADQSPLLAMGGKATINSYESVLGASQSFGQPPWGQKADPTADIEHRNTLLCEEVGQVSGGFQGVDGPTKAEANIECFVVSPVASPLAKGCQGDESSRRPAAAASVSSSCASETSGSYEPSYLDSADCRGSFPMGKAAMAALWSSSTHPSRPHFSLRLPLPLPLDEPQSSEEYRPALNNVAEPPKIEILKTSSPCADSGWCMVGHEDVGTLSPALTLCQTPLMLPGESCLVPMSQTATRGSLANISEGAFEGCGPSQFCATGPVGVALMAPSPAMTWQTVTETDADAAGGVSAVSKMNATEFAELPPPRTDGADLASLAQLVSAAATRVMTASPHEPGAGDCSDPITKPFNGSKSVIGTEADALSKDPSEVLTRVRSALARVVGHSASWQTSEYGTRAAEVEVVGSVVGACVKAPSPLTPTEFGRGCGSASKFSSVVTSDVVPGREQAATAASSRKAFPATASASAPAPAPLPVASRVAKGNGRRQASIDAATAQREECHIDVLEDADTGAAVTSVASSSKNKSLLRAVSPGPQQRRGGGPSSPQQIRHSQVDASGVDSLSRTSPARRSGNRAPTPLSGASSRAASPPGADGSVSTPSRSPCMSAFVGSVLSRAGRTSAPATATASSPTGMTSMLDKGSTSRPSVETPPSPPLRNIARRRCRGQPVDAFTFNERVNGNVLSSETQARLSLTSSHHGLKNTLHGDGDQSMTPQRPRESSHQSSTLPQPGHRTVLGGKAEKVNIRTQTSERRSSVSPQRSGGIGTGGSKDRPMSKEISKIRQTRDVTSSRRPVSPFERRGHRSTAFLW